MKYTIRRKSVVSNRNRQKSNLKNRSKSMRGGTVSAPAYQEHTPHSDLEYDDDSWVSPSYTNELECIINKIIIEGPRTTPKHTAVDTEHIKIFETIIDQIKKEGPNWENI